MRFLEVYPKALRVFIPWGFRVVSEITRNTWLDFDSMIAHVDVLEIIANLVDNLHLFLSCFVNAHLGKTMSCSKVYPTQVQRITSIFPNIDGNTATHWQNIKIFRRIKQSTYFAVPNSGVAKTLIEARPDAVIHCEESAQIDVTRELH